MATPNYKKIYTDLLNSKHPDKKHKCENILSKKELNFIDVIRLNEIIFDKGDKETQEMNQKYRSYDKNTVIKILKYQEDNNLSNVQVANYFRMSRTTLLNWKKSGLFK
jgi:DNA-binding transcriptional regulator YiaG